MSVARLVAVEGIDGSGKGTQVARLVDRLNEQSINAVRLSFPRYSETRFGEVIGRFLNGGFGSLGEVHPQLVSLLFAGDRFESRDVLLKAMEDCDIVILDRYVSSNIAHQCAKVPNSDERDELRRFIEHLEFGIYQLPRPDLKILLDITVSESQELITRKSRRDYTDEVADLQEADGDYMSIVRGIYAELAVREPDWCRIECIENGQLRGIESISDELLEVVRHVV